MVSLAGLEGAQLHQTVSKVAEFLGARDGDVTRLLEDRRLESAILSHLRRRGIAVTPSVKNSVQLFVRRMEPAHQSPESSAAPGSPFQSDATATIMFTDIVDSSSIMEHLGDREGKRLLARHAEIIRREATAHEGSEVKSMGDGPMLTFHSARRAVASAAAMQRALAEYNRRPARVPVSVRIGLSVGEPVSDQKDLFGVSVIKAARITARANGGQVLVCHIAHALASSSGEFSFRPVGPVELKGLAGSHHLYEVLW